MYIIFYYLKVRLAYFVYGKSYKSSAFFKSGELYKKYNGSDKKSRWQVFKELNDLAKYWKCYPDTYFFLMMFKKGFGDISTMKTFIPQKIYGKYAKNKEPKYEILINDKILFHDIMTFYGIPTTNRYFSYAFGVFRNHGKVLQDVEVDELLSKISAKRIFVKRNKCGCGSGISVAVKNNDGYFYSKEGMKLTAKNIREAYLKEEILFEEEIVQDECTKKFNPDSVNTLRVLTFKNKIVGCIIRTGRKGSIIDNATAGGVFANVDIETGGIGEYAVKEYDSTIYYEHPDTHVPFKDQYISQWKQVVGLVNKVCELMPYYSSVGFDIACSNNGPIVVEINTGAEVLLNQVTINIGLADAFINAN